MAKIKQTKPVVEQFDAEERAATMEAALVDLLDSGKFQFVRGQGRLNRKAHPPCGCVIGGLTVFVGPTDVPNYEDYFYTIESTGLATYEELRAMEQGYEFGSDYEKGGDLIHLKPELHHGPFFEAGCRLRARPDATPYWLPKS